MVDMTCGEPVVRLVSLPARETSHLHRLSEAHFVTEKPAFWVIGGLSIEHPSDAIVLVRCDQTTTEGLGCEVETHEDDVLQGVLKSLEAV